MFEDTTVRNHETETVLMLHNARVGTRNNKSEKLSVMFFIVITEDILHKFELTTCTIFFC